MKFQENPTFRPPDPPGGPQGLPGPPEAPRDPPRTPRNGPKRPESARNGPRDPGFTQKYPFLYGRLIWKKFGRCLSVFSGFFGFFAKTAQIGLQIDLIFAYGAQF